MAGLNSLVTLYENMVEEADKKGYAEKFKKCAELLFDSLSKAENPKHVIDIQYLDGYFIFGTGSNSVVHFHIKECPGWKFGVWWNLPDKEKHPDAQWIEGEFFCQHEEDIDKFKPSYSMYSHSFTITLSDIDGEEKCQGMQWSNWTIESIMTFIHKHPILAWYRNYYGVDYNTEYKSLIRILIGYIKHKLRNSIDNFVEPKLDKAFSKFVKKEILPYLGDGAKLVDCGPNWSPRYDIFIPITPQDIANDIKTGCYGIFDEDGDEENKKLEDRWYNKANRLHKISKFLGIYWYEPVHQSYFLYDPSKEENE